jgi:6-pyruvoyltetrahydropterin/6-carboxytetrahydropterin synthase
MHGIVKRIHLCYGHRLMNYTGRCAHPHGHNGIAEVELSCESLDDKGMVYDFGALKARLMEFIDKELDHRMILREDDPLVAALNAVGESAYVMRENPTAENLARLIYREALSRSLPVVAVRFWETETSMAEYREEHRGR